MSHTESKALKNIGANERWFSLLLGGGLLALGARGNERLPWLLAGGFFLYRGARGYCPVYDFFGLNTTELHLQQATSVPHRRGIKVEQSIIINKPPEELYRFWSNL
jgi:uncharacterized membrane protein